MADLAVFSSDMEDNGAITTPITPTPTKRGRPRKGGDLSTVGKGQISNVTSLNFDENSIRSITLISETLGSDFLPRHLQRLQEKAASMALEFAETKESEEALTIASQLNIERAKNIGREAGDRQMELRQLTKLKNEADKWMDEQFENMVMNYATIGISYSQIVTMMKNHASKLHIDLSDFQINKTGQWDFPDHKFIHEDKIEFCKSRLAELGVETDKLRALGIEVE
jgi:hypothetical protein